MARSSKELTHAAPVNGATTRPSEIDFWSPRVFDDVLGFASAGPWEMMRRIQSELDAALDRFSPGSEMTRAGRGGGMAELWSPSLDVSETNDEYLVEAELPGVKLEDVAVEALDGALRLSARMEEHQETHEKRYLRRERRYGSFERTLAVPEGVEADEIRCEFRDGVLRCHLPKSPQAQARAKGRMIPIEAQAQLPSQPGTPSQGEPRSK